MELSSTDSEPITEDINFWGGMSPEPSMWSTLMCALTHTPPATLALVSSVLELPLQEGVVHEQSMNHISMKNKKKA